MKVNEVLVRANTPFSHPAGLPDPFDQMQRAIIPANAVEFKKFEPRNATR
jgi:hypothetical protein